MSEFWCQPANFARSGLTIFLTVQSEYDVSVSLLLSSITLPSSALSSYVRISFMAYVTQRKPEMSSGADGIPRVCMDSVGISY